jgi:hypothetical protein
MNQEPTPRTLQAPSTETPAQSATAAAKPAAAVAAAPGAAPARKRKASATPVARKVKAPSPAKVKAAAPGTPPPAAAAKAVLPKAAAPKAEASKAAASKAGAAKVEASKAGTAKAELAKHPKKVAKPRPLLVRDSFTMPEADFALIAKLKSTALSGQRATKKSELLRAGLQVLASLDAPGLLVVLDRLETVKTGRPKKGH